MKYYEIVETTRKQLFNMIVASLTSLGAEVAKVVTVFVYNSSICRFTTMGNRGEQSIILKTITVSSEFEY